MKPVPKEERTKLAVLAIAVVAVFGFVFMRLFSELGPKGTPSVAAAKTPSSAPAAETSSAESTEDESPVEIPRKVAGSAGDPFRSVRAEKVASTGFKRVNRKEFARPAALKGTVPVLPPVTDNSGLPPARVDLNGLIGEGSSAEVLDYRPSVKGIITGVHPIAVIQIADKTHVVPAGQKFGDGMQVILVDERQVIVQKGRERMVLPVGGG